MDVPSGIARPGTTVLVQGDRITAVGPSKAIRVPSGTRELKGDGRFLIPGLWDMHAHTGMRELYLPLYVANGITGIRIWAG